MTSILAAIAATVALGLIGVMAGVFFAFSVSVMPGLDAVKPAEAIHAMQSINRKILNPVFLTTFVGAPIASAITGALLLVRGQDSVAVLAFAAAAVYLAGVMTPTAAINVPMNNALDALTAPADEVHAATQWSSYSTRWTRWNTVRGAFNTVALLLIGLALFVWGRQG